MPPTPELPVFDEPFGFRIRHIKVASNDHSAGSRFQNDRWKPPTHMEGVELLQGLRYGINDRQVTHDTKFVWNPPQVQQDHFYWQGNPVLEMQQHEKPAFRRHKAATVFWAPDSHTFLHVPLDCTQEHVEDPLNHDTDPNSDHEGEERAADDVRIARPGQAENDQPQVVESQRRSWRRLRFFHHYRGAEHPTISIARYDAGANELGGSFPDRWRSTLIPSVHQPEPECDYSLDCQLAGDLPLILALIAFNHEDPKFAVAAINDWFPPSRRTTHWEGEQGHGVNLLQRADQSKLRSSHFGSSL